MSEPIGRFGSKRAIDNDDIRLGQPAQRFEAGVKAASALDADARFLESRFHGRRLERRVGDDEGARPRRKAAPRLRVGERRRRVAFRQSEWEGEDRPAAWIVGKRKLSAHEADKLARDREPQTRAFEATRVRAIALLETVENRRPTLRWHPGSGVDHRKLRRTVFAAFDRDTDAALVGEFDRIAGEVGKNLTQALAVGANEARRSGAKRGGDLDALALGARREQFDDALGEPAQIDHLDDEIESASLDLGQIEDLVDQRDERAPRTANRFHVACVFGIKRGVPQQVGHAQNAADRGADFVAHRRQKARFGLARRLCPVTRARRFLEPPEFVAQPIVLGGDLVPPRFRLAPAACDSRGKRNGQSRDRARLQA